jgi:hypothetical protein
LFLGANVGASAGVDCVFPKQSSIFSVDTNSKQNSDAFFIAAVEANQGTLTEGEGSVMLTSLLG